MASRYNLRPRSRRTVTFDNPDVVMDVELRAADVQNPRQRKQQSLRRVPQRRQQRQGLHWVRMPHEGWLRQLQKEQQQQPQQAVE